MADPHRALLVLGAFALCGQTCLWMEVLCAQTSGISKYEIVIPERRQLKQKRDVKLHDEAAQGAWEDKLSYSIEAAGRPYLLRLERNTGLLSDQFTQSKYTKDGRLEDMQRKEETHCYYHGRVDGVEDSMVALSTCDGLRGVLHIHEQSYGIEPMESSSRGEHILYQLRDVHKGPSLCGVMSTDGGWPEKTRSAVNDSYQEINGSYTAFHRHDLYRRKRAVLPVTSFVELSVMVDNNRYKMQGSNAAAVKKDVFELVNILSVMYYPLNIQIVLIELNIWMDNNPFDVDDGTAGDVLGRFTTWRRTAAGLKRSDISHLLVGRGAYVGSVVGMAFVGTVCNGAQASSISAFSSGSSPASHATVFAHELGHNLGMNHDDKICGTKYIMCSFDSRAQSFSSCSSNDFEKLILNNKGTCLKNAPNPQQVLTEPACGNNIVDQGEECDCGTVQQCKNPCCNAATCTLTSGSQCAQGLCCENCKFKGSSSECRPQSDPCDLPEYCNGTGSYCPSDFYIMDGYPCNDSQSYCYGGRCQTFDAQCKALFGAGYTKANDGCFSVANLKGDGNGNCGMSGGIYKKCALSDSLCGKLQCTGQFAAVPGATVTTFMYNNIYQCLNINFELGPDVPDPGMVHQGTGCGNGKACVNNACVNSSELGYNCDVKNTCNDRAVCNNLGNCHCNYGWGPPYCESGGCGGSLDSGPPPCDNRLRDALLIIFLLVLPVLVLVVLFFKRNAIKACIRRRKDRYRADNNVPARQTARPPNQNQQRKHETESSNIQVTDVFTISRFRSQRPPETSTAPPKPPPRPLPPLWSDVPERPPVPPRPLGFQNV
ncbi:disintegrin and metalloproteinase domain-containing protein 9-like [Ambystoma mexicanum]|uniref:disintegrin and metalloproteinase domain-containing protein 9-like n=1 Tax=Ambystoma mexicanum TaxID=8296 RepID=UPI0037E7612E